MKMFRKTRNRIMLLNMAMVSTVVIVAFVVIFLTTYTREQASNRRKLQNDIIPQLSIAAGPINSDFPGGVLHVEPNMFRTAGFARYILPDAGLSFSLLVDSDGALIEVNSMVNLPDAAYRKAAMEATKEGVHTQTVSLEGRTWQYAVNPLTVEFIASGEASLIVSGAYKDVRFLDVTDSHRMLWSLGLTLSGLTALILAAFWFISRVFANRAIRPMEEAFEKQNRFVADASHELKTPLSVISANCGVLYANKDGKVEDQLRWIDSIMRASDRMTGLVSDLLSLACIEDKDNELICSVFDVGGAVSDAVSEMEQLAREKGLSIQMRIEPGVNVKSDRASVGKILAILLDNAIKYTDEGGEITVDVSREKSGAVCAVKNSGGGVPEEELPRLFDRFYRGDPARSDENRGSGLGLSIAAAAAERLGASLTAASVPGQYTELRLTM